MERVIGISEYIVSSDTRDTLRTYSLGSCVGLALYDPIVRIGGMLHSMMPAAKANREKSSQNPAMYTDAGAERLLKELFGHGATRANLIAYLAGCGSHFEPTGGMFHIGESNYTVVRKVLWKNGILIAAEDVGGTVSRTMSMELRTGRTHVESHGEVRELVPSLRGRSAWL